MRMNARIVSALVAAPALFIGATAPAAVQPQPGEVVVQTVRPTGGESWLVVRYSDLAMATPSGQRSLLQRVGFAIETLCGGTNLSDPTYSLKCSNEAHDSVQPQLARLIVR